MTGRYINQKRLNDEDARLDIMVDNRHRPAEQETFTAHRRKQSRRPLTVPEQQFVREMIIYDRESGKLRLNPDRPAHHFTCRKAHRNWLTKIFRGEPGIPVGPAVIHPYTRNDGSIGEEYAVPVRFVGMPHHPEAYNRRLSLPSVVWFLHHGYWPRGKILRADRRDRDSRPNFHISNLYSTDPADVSFL